MKTTILMLACGFALALTTTSTPLAESNHPAAAVVCDTGPGHNLILHEYEIPLPDIAGTTVENEFYVVYETANPAESQKRTFADKKNYIDYQQHMTDHTGYTRGSTEIESVITIGFSDNTNLPRVSHDAAV